MNDIKDSKMDAVVDLPRSCRPSTATTEENIHQIKNLVLQNRRLSLRELGEEVNISFKSVHYIMTDILCLKRVAARLVPKELSFVRKDHRIKVAANMISRASIDVTFLKRIITGDETWVYECDMQTSQQSSEWP